jgi:tetratricopeptide (TPR) repeat protein
MRTVPCLLLLLATYAGAPGRVQAQSALERDAADRRVDRARTLFTDGVSYVAQERYPEAESRFREALELRDAPAIRYNLASVLFEQGEYPEARVHVDRVLADGAAPGEIRDHANELRGQIAARAGWVRIEASGVVEGAFVAIDGYRLPDLESEHAVAPGAHVATASFGSREAARTEFEVATGDHRTVELGGDGESDGAAASSAGEAPLHEQWWLWTAIGGGVVVIAVVVGVAATSSGGVESPVVGNFEPGLLRW